MIGDVCFWPSKFEWYIFIVLFSNGSSRKCNDLFLTSMTSTYIELDLLFPAVASELQNSLQFKKKRGHKSTPISLMRNSAPADTKYLKYS